MRSVLSGAILPLWGAAETQCVGRHGKAAGGGLRPDVKRIREPVAPRAALNDYYTHILS